MPNLKNVCCSGADNAEDNAAFGSVNLD